MAARARGPPGLVRPPGGELVERLLGRPLRVGRRPARRMRVDVRFGRRGRRTLSARDAFGSSDPLGLAEQVLESTLIDADGAAAHRARAGARWRRRRRDSGRTSRPLAAAAEVELDALRPYRPGRPAGRIHWPTVARTGDVIERRLAAEADSRPLVVLDPRRPPSDDALDRAVRAAASLCVHLARGRRLRAAPAGRSPGVGAGPRAARVAGPARAPGAGPGGRSAAAGRAHRARGAHLLGGGGGERAAGRPGSRGGVRALPGTPVPSGPAAAAASWWRAARDARWAARQGARRERAAARRARGSRPHPRPAARDGPLGRLRFARRSGSRHSTALAWFGTDEWAGLVDQPRPAARPRSRRS